MKTKRAFPRITVTKKAELSLKNGHPWVYGAEVLEREPAENGSVADVFSEKGTYLGSGFYNDQSKILVRVLSKNANDAFDEAFFRRRIRYAIDYRKTVMGEEGTALEPPGDAAEVEAAVAGELEVHLRIPHIESVGVLHLLHVQHELQGGGMGLQGELAVLALDLAEQVPVGREQLRDHVHRVNVGLVGHAGEQIPPLLQLQIGRAHV